MTVWRSRRSSYERCRVWPFVRVAGAGLGLGAVDLSTRRSVRTEGRCHAVTAIAPHGRGFAGCRPATLDPMIVATNDTSSVVLQSRRLVQHGAAHVLAGFGHRGGDRALNSSPRYGATRRVGVRPWVCGVHVIKETRQDPAESPG